MWTIFIALSGLSLVLWLLVKLRELREKPVEQLPNDEATLMLGLFYGYVAACLNYYKDKRRYPAVMRGAADGLEELGYLRGNKIIAESVVSSLFTLVITENTGYGICLFKVRPDMANKIIERAAEKDNAPQFMHFDMENLAYRPLSLPIKEEVNLVLPLPFRK